MPLYRYQPHSVIDEIVIETNDRGASRAYLHAGAGGSPEALAAARARFKALGWHSVPMSISGHPVLELRGFKNPKQLLDETRNLGLVDGAHAPTPTAGDKVSFGDVLRNKTLQATGATYMLADAAFSTYAGMELNKHYKELNRAKALGKEAEALARESVRGGWWKIASGVGYAIGSVILAAYGSHDQSQSEIKKSVGKIDRYIRQQGLSPVNGGPAVAQEPDKKDTGLLGAADALLKRYPSEALNIVYTGVGLLLMRSSLNQVHGLKEKLQPLKKGTDEFNRIRSELRSERLDIGLGTITATSAMAGLLIKEKKPLEGEHRRSGLAGVWDWIQEKPLRATGIGYMAATGVHAITTARKWRALPGETVAQVADKRKIMSGRAAFVVLSMAAEAMLAISSKGHGEGVQTDRSTEDSVVAATAEFIARQPEANRDLLIERLSGYMSSPDVMGQRAELIAGKLREQIGAIQTNPWSPVSQQAAVVPTQPHLAPIAALPKPQVSAPVLEARLSAAPEPALAH